MEKFAFDATVKLSNVSMCRVGSSEWHQIELLLCFMTHPRSQGFFTSTPRTGRPPYLKGKAPWGIVTLK